MPNAQVIGRVAVKVMPDTSDFRRQLKNQLDKIEKSIGQVDVKLNLDENGITEKAKAVAEKVKKELKSITLKINPDSANSLQSALAQVNNEIEKLNQIDLKVELDRSSLEAAKALLQDQLDKVATLDLRIDKTSETSIARAISQLDAELEKLREIDMKVHLDKTSLEEARRELQAKLDQAAKVKIELDNQAFRKMRTTIQNEMSKIPFNPTIDPAVVKKARSEIEKTLTQIHDLQASIVPGMSERDKHAVESDIKDLRDKLDKLKDTQINPQLDPAGTRVAAAKVAILTRDRTVSIIPVVSKAATTKVAATLAALSGARVLDKYVRGLAESLANLDKNIPIIGTIAEAIAGLAAAGLSGASNLFALSASLAQIGGAALALPGIFAGIGVGLGITMLALKDMKKVLPDVYQQFQQMKHEISRDFWSGAATGIRELATVYLPHLGDAAKEVGTFWGTLAHEMSVPFKTALGPMFDNLRKSIQIATDHANVFASIITTLGLTGSEYLPRLAQWFGDVATKFDTWLSAAAKSGKLAGWIDSAVFAIQELGRVGAGAGKILKGIADAAQAAGGSNLTGLADALARIADTVNGPLFQRALIGTFQAAHTAMDNLSKGAGPGLSKLFLSLSQTAQAVLPVVGDTIGQLIGSIGSALAQPAVQKGIQDLFDGLAAGVQAVLPYLPSIALALGAIGTVAGALAKNLGPVLGAAFGGLADIVTTLAPALLPIIDILGPALTDVIKLVVPEVQKIATALANLLTPEVVAGLQTFVDETLASLGDYLPKLGDAFVKVVEAVAPLLPQLLSFATDVLPPLIDAAGQLLDKLLPLIEAFGKFIDFVAPLVGWVGQLAGQIIGPLWLAYNALTILLGTLVENAGPIFDTLKQLFSDVFEFSLPGIVLNAVDGIKGLWDDLGSYLGDKMSSIGTTISGIWSSIRDNTGPIVTDLCDRIKANFESARANVASKMSSIKATVSDSWSSLKGLTGSAMERFGKAVRDGFGKVARLFGALPAQIKSAVGNLGGLLVSAGEDAVRGFIAGIASKIPSAKEVAASLASAVSKTVSNMLIIRSPSRVMKKIGGHTADGFIIGIQEKIPTLKAALQQLGSAMPSMVSTNIGKVNSVIGSMSSVLTATQKGHLNSLVTQSQTALKLVDDAQARLNDRLKAAQSYLADLQKQAASYATGISDKINQTGNVTSGDDHTFTAIWQNLLKARNAATDFAKVLDQLQKAGLNKAALDQIAQAGPDAGLAAGKSILAAGKKGITEINTLQSQLASAAAKAGSTTADAMFKNGIHMAEGLLAGLKQMQKPLEDQMVAIGKSLVAAIKKELKIKSPSRVFMEVGGFVGQGFADGISGKANAVASAMSEMASQRPSGQSMNLAAAVDASLADGSAGAQRVLHYHAAEGSSINAEEDLFAAAERSRMVNW